MRHIFNDACHFITFIPGCKCLPYRIAFTEVPGGYFFSQRYLVRFQQSPAGISLYNLAGEDVKQS